jgi:hypothetical protein
MLIRRQHPHPQCEQQVVSPPKLGPGRPILVPAPVPVLMVRTLPSPVAPYRVQQ